MGLSDGRISNHNISVSTNISFYRILIGRLQEDWAYTGLKIRQDTFALLVNNTAQQQQIRLSCYVLLPPYLPQHVCQLMNYPASPPLGSTIKSIRAEIPNTQRATKSGVLREAFPERQRCFAARIEERQCIYLGLSHRMSYTAVALQNNNNLLRGKKIAQRYWMNLQRLQ